MKIAHLKLHIAIRHLLVSLLLAFCLIPFKTMAQNATSSVSVAAGWTLLGNGTTAPISVASTFNNASNVVSVWKWDSANTTWSFYSPSYNDGGVSYAALQGYQALTLINPGDGYWVNSNVAFSLPQTSATNYGYSNYLSSSPGALLSGWNLISVGDSILPTAFNKALNSTAPSSNSTANDVTSIWAWDSSKTQWYFYSPNLDRAGTLTSYIAQQCYEDFITNSKLLQNGVGFWVNNPIANLSSVKVVLTGLPSASSLLISNGSQSQSASYNGTYNFTVPTNSTYNVTAGTPPAGQNCTVTNGSGTAVNSNAISVAVNCTTKSYTLSGTISGLTGSVTLQNNGTNPLTLTANGTFSFTTQIASEGSYAVTISSQPSGQTCSIANNSGAGSFITGNISNISIVCSKSVFTVSGTISGLVGSITLNDNLSDALVVTSNGSFTFQTPIPSGGSYSVSVAAQPNNQVCSISSGANINVSANVSTVMVTCVAGSGSTTYPVQTAMASFWQSKSKAILNVYSGFETINSTAYGVVGQVTYSNSVNSNSTFNNSSAILVTETTSGRLCVGSTNTNASCFASTATFNEQVEVGILSYYLNTQFSPIGLVSSGSYCIANTNKGYPTSVVSGQTGVIGVFDCYSDSSKNNLIGSTTMTFDTVPASASSIYFRVSEYGYDTSNNLLQTSSQVYLIASSGANTTLVQTSLSYKVNAQTNSTPTRVDIVFSQ